MSLVLDSYAVFVYLEKEPGYEKVRDLFIDAAETGSPLLLSSWNMVTDRSTPEILSASTSWDTLNFLTATYAKFCGTRRSI